MHVLTASAADLDSCASEPIHIPGAIQPHGALLVLDMHTRAVLQASQNLLSFTGLDLAADGVLAASLPDLDSALAAWSPERSPSLQVRLEEQALVAIAHRSDAVFIVEFERIERSGADSLVSRLGSFAQLLSGENDIAGSLRACATFVAELTGFDRVLVYRFDAEWNGHVVAEANNGGLPSYLDLRFPSGDIPAQARHLYTINRVRMIPDASYQPVPIVRADAQQPRAHLDLSLSQLRSVSPVHLEYMRNMGTAASMSVSVIVDGALWGLVSCHSAAPHGVSISVRDACDFVVQSLAMRISALERAEAAAESVELAEVHSRLLTRMSQAQSWHVDLLAAQDDLLQLVGAEGAAILTDDQIVTTGRVPERAHIAEITDWLKSRGEEFFHSSCLAADLPQDLSSPIAAAGMLAISLSGLHSNWLVWFRPEIVRTVKWGGDPHKLVREAGRIHPRKSFDTWREQVRDQSAPWTQSQIGAARNLRGAIVGIVLRKAEELAQLTGELQRSNKELEAFSYSVSHDLRAPFRHIVGFAELLRSRETTLDEKSLHYLQTISDAAVAAGKLVDDLLNFSQLGRTALSKKPVDMNKLVLEVLRSLKAEQEGRDIDIQVADLPPGFGDATLLRQVWYNLLENAVKYTRPRKRAEIVVGGQSFSDQTVYSVSDNGVGFDMQYVGKVFGVFQRLQRAEDFEGTGIGLALVRRIIERHDGTVSASGEVDKGASFSFALPLEKQKDDILA